MKPPAMDGSSRFSSMAQILAEVFPNLVNSVPGPSPAERAEILRQFHKQTGRSPEDEGVLP